MVRIMSYNYHCSFPHSHDTSSSLKYNVPLSCKKLEKMGRTDLKIVI
uniref:Uncharacterized protein n=1 Tax=Arundo donax TaxID=35708 RepID=A0A0A9ATC0_ARUDO